MQARCNSGDPYTLLFCILSANAASCIVKAVNGSIFLRL